MMRIIKMPSFVSRAFTAPPPPPPLSAREPRPAPGGGHVFDRAMLTEALNAYTRPHRSSSLAYALACWAVRELGGDAASSFADALVKGVQIERRRIAREAAGGPDNG